MADYVTLADGTRVQEGSALWHQIESERLLAEVPALMKTNERRARLMMDRARLHFDLAQAMRARP